MNKEENKKLIEEFPFLWPLDWNYEPVKELDYKSTLLDDMPEGWKKCFGIQMVKDFKKQLEKENALENYKVYQVKEKYGSLRWYDNYSSKEFDCLKDKYEYLSEHVCVNCGKINVPMFNSGWISPMCEECFIKCYKIEKNVNNYKINEADMKDKFSIKRYSQEKTEILEYDISDILKKLNYKK